MKLQFPVHELSDGELSGDELLILERFKSGDEGYGEYIPYPYYRVVIAKSGEE